MIIDSVCVTAGRGQTVERALDLDLLSRSTSKRLNVIFLLLIQPYNSFEIHLSLSALNSIVKVARFQLQSVFFLSTYYSYNHLILLK